VANKQVLAALTNHMRVKALAQGMQPIIPDYAGAPLRVLVDAVLDRQVSKVMHDARAWTALFMLDRRTYQPATYRKHYARFVVLWEHALAAAGNSDGCLSRRSGTTSFRATLISCSDPTRRLGRLVASGRAEIQH